MNYLEWKLMGGIKGLCWLLAQNWQVTLCLGLVGAAIYVLTG